MTRSARLALPALLAAALLAGCTSGGTDDPAASSGGADLDGTQQAAGDGAASSSGAGVLGRAQLAGSAVVRTAELGVRVDDVRAAADEAGRLVRDAGGQLASERTDGRDDVASAELVLRVPPERFDELLGRLAGLGEEHSRAVSTEEVGDELVDLQSRLATQRASVERVRALLDEASSLGDVVQVEAELTRRTADLESLAARRAALEGRVELSTVSLRLDARDVVAAAGPAGFLGGLQSGWAALLAALTVLATLAGAVLPFVPLAAAAGWLVLRARRRRPAAGPAAA